MNARVTAVPDQCSARARREKFIAPPSQVLERAEPAREQQVGRHDDQREGGVGGGESAPFQRGELPFEERACRVRGARVVVLAELRRRRLAERGRLVDRRGDRPVRVGAGRVEPMVSFRTWMQADLPASLQSTFSLRYEWNSGRLGISPMAGYTIGKLGATANESSSLSGYRAQLTIRMQ